jgi:serine phosphatase RsbU (regulator of sigma subunit)
MKTKSLFATGFLSHPRMLSLIINRWGQLEFASKGLANLLGVNPNDLSGEGWIKHINSPVQRNRIKKEIYSLLLAKQKEALFIETELKTAEGTTKCIRWDLSLLPDGDVFCLGQDITEIKKSEQLVKQQIELLKEKNKNILESIGYAERLQNQILQSVSHIRKIHPDCFVFFKPKDLLSGDYYRVERVGDTEVIIVADCTGHGIPGAMMAFLAHSFFHDAMNKLPENPSDLLFEADEYFSKALNSSGENRCMDGMDASVVYIDRKRSILKFSMASRYGVLFSQNELKVLSGSKFSIGFSGFKKDYFTEEIAFEAGEMLYLFTDGYADQFGGQNNKKLNRKNFLEILKDASLLSVNEQRSYLEYCLNSWKQDTEQTDDITVLGYRI